jgi:hypothetical protein
MSGYSIFATLIPIIISISGLQQSGLLITAPNIKSSLNVRSSKALVSFVNLYIPPFYFVCRASLGTLHQEVFVARFLSSCFFVMLVGVKA